MGILDRFRKKKKDSNDSVKQPSKSSKVSTGQFCSFNGAWCEKDGCDNCKKSAPNPEELTSNSIDTNIIYRGNEKSLEEKVAELNKARELNLINRKLWEQQLEEEKIELERIRAEEALPELPHARPKHQVTPNICDFCGHGFYQSSINRYSYYDEKPHIEQVPKQHYLPYTCDYCGGTFCDEHRLPENHDCVILQHKAWKYYKAYKGKYAT